jgi:hypothetical protein
MRDLRSLSFSAEWEEYIGSAAESVEYSAVV